LASLKPEEQREKVAEIEAATAGTTGMKKRVVSARSSVIRNRASKLAKKSQKPSKLPTVNMLMLCAGYLGR
jgi:hypothetical protein